MRFASRCHATHSFCIFIFFLTDLEAFCLSGIDWEDSQTDLAHLGGAAPGQAKSGGDKLWEDNWDDDDIEDDFSVQLRYVRRCTLKSTVIRVWSAFHCDSELSWRRRKARPSRCSIRPFKNPQAVTFSSCIFQSFYHFVSLGILL